MPWQWRLPQPTGELDMTKEWLPVERIYPQMPVPFGYKVDPLDPYILLPIPHELDVMQKGKQLLKEFTYEEVANWITEQTGRQIRGQSLHERLKRERVRRRRINRINAYTERVQKAKEAAQKIERTTTSRFRTCDPEARNQLCFDFGDTGSD